MERKKAKTHYNPLVFIEIILIAILIMGCLYAAFHTDRSGMGDDVTGNIYLENIEKKQADTARPSKNGRLHVDGKNLVDEKGEAVQLRGVSTHGLTWYPQFISENLFKNVSTDWNCNMLRLAMYASKYSGGEKEDSLAMLRKGIDAAVKADMYVLVDWHMLEKGDPNEEIAEAMDFFEIICREYADCPNLIFEICNEPNGSADWTDVVKYSDKVIPLIRKYIPESVIVVGTPEYDRNLSSPLMRPLAFDNVMYVLHFYAATHGSGLREELIKCYEAGLPVFISECGICEADGDGAIAFSNAAEWFSLLNEYKISYAIWSLSDKDESSAFFKPGFNPENIIRDENLTESGLWVRSLIRGFDPKVIVIPSDVVPKDNSLKTRIGRWINNSLGDRGKVAVRSWPLFAAIAGILIIVSIVIGGIYYSVIKKKRRTYDDIVSDERGGLFAENAFSRVCIIIGVFLTVIYLCWRVVWSVPVGYGAVAIAGNILLLVVEIIGFIESMIMFRNLIGLKKHPLPEIPDDKWPEVDIFIATYNEPTELLCKTINGCTHLKYPDPKKVHIWVCDDNRRPAMRALAKKMGVGYFDRPDNKGAKAGNLNHAMGLTSAPYIVTLDADMIPKSDFLLKTIPYFVDAELREEKRPENERLHLGLLQTPQCFYDPDVFQHALYSEKRAPNEQDFFYRTIEPAKTSTNSVIYGGSNTILSRKALEDIGGFYTGSITEDFATGLLIESAGYVSLALPEPLASGQTPHTFREHIQQRTRWGRGVVVTAKKLKIWRRKNLSFAQKVNYWSSKIYWYSPVKNLIYMLSPLFYAVLALPVFKCNWLELVLFWFPMFILQDLNLRLNSKNAISTKWSGIYETSVMPHLLIPVIKETLGISLTKFAVTDKSKKKVKREKDIKSMLPFLILALLSVAGIIRLIAVFTVPQIISSLILLFWLVRNLYFLIMAMFLVDGRDSDGETVKVLDAESVKVRKYEQSISYVSKEDVAAVHDASAEKQAGVKDLTEPSSACENESKSGKTEKKYSFEGVTTLMTEHNLTVFLDESEELILGDHVEVVFRYDDKEFAIKGVVTGINVARKSDAKIHQIEILDFCGNKLEYLELLYDRVPTLPQSLRRDFGVIPHLWQNIAYRVARTRK